MKDPKDDQFYEHIYGISRISPRYWWRRRSEHRVFFAMLFLLAVASPIALAIWGPSLKPWVVERYHALRAARYRANAQAFLNGGDPQSARIALQNALRHAPADPDSLAFYASTLRGLHESGYALWALNAHGAKPDDPRIATLALGYALEENQTEVAEFIIRDSLPRFPKNAALRILACHQLMRKGNFAAALRLAKLAKGLAPENAEASFLVACLSSRSGDTKTRDAALAELRAFREKPEFQIRASWALLNALSNADPKAAIAILDELIRADRTAWQARQRRAVIGHRLDPSRTTDALGDLWTTADTAARRLLVIETAETLAPTDAQKLIDSLDESERRALPALLAQLRLWARAKEWGRVADAANRASQTDSPFERVTLTLWLAKANRELGERSAALTCLRTALARCEGDATLALRAAMQLERLGLRDDAAPFYELVNSKAPGRMGVFARSRLGTIEHLAGRTEEMLKNWEEALAKTPRDPQAMNNVASCLLLLGRDTPRALSLSSEAHATRPGSAFFGDTHALALATAGRVTEALAIHEKMPKQRLSQADFALNYAAVLDMAGRKVEAVALASNLNQAALLPEQVVTRQRILGVGGTPQETLLLNPAAPVAEPTLPKGPAKPLGPLPDTMGSPIPMSPEFMPLPSLDGLGLER